MRKLPKLNNQFLEKPLRAVFVDSKVNYTWDLGDGTRIEGQGSTISYTYEDGSKFNIRLEITYAIAKSLLRN